MFAAIVIDWSDILGYAKDVWFIFLVLIGFGIIIFVHELGHFLMAKFVGIRIETFAIGFGPRLLGFKRGDTDYCLRLLPLGGYVKMLGQEDFTLDQDRVDATKVDPASFLAKTPGQRALVVSGGVAMNVLFAAIGFIFVFMHGLQFGAPIAGGVLPGSPADRAGIKSGDKFLAVDREKILHFSELQLAVATSDPVSGVDLEIERDGKAIHTKVIPLKNTKAELLQIGIAGAGSLNVDEPGMVGPDGKNLEKGDKIVRADSITPKYYDDVEQVLVKAAGKPVELTVERKVDGRVKQVTLSKRAYLMLFSDMEKAPSGTTLPSTKNLTDIDQEYVSILGLVPRRKFIYTPDIDVKKDEANYVQAGDIILRVGNIMNPTWKEIRDYLEPFGRKTVEIEVIRGSERKQIKLYVPWRQQMFRMLMGEIGFDDMNPIVSDVLTKTPAAKLNMPRGAKILSCDDKPVSSWFDVVDCFKAGPGKQVKIAFEYGGKVQTGILAVPKDRAWEQNVTYAIDFFCTPLKTMIKGNDPLQAIALGLRQTWNMIKMVYVTIQRVAFTRTIGVRQLSGPIYIIHQGKMVAEAGFNQLLYYLALISANLAVINFLPIPVVDGGLMIILLLEKVRGKMLSPRATAVWQGVGLSLIVALFVFVTYNDVLKLIRGQ